MSLFTKIKNRLVDIVTHADKYRKAAIVPAGIIVYVVSTYLGASSTITLEVIGVLTALGVYQVPNAS